MEYIEPQQSTFWETSFTGVSTLQKPSTVDQNDPKILKQLTSNPSENRSTVTKNSCKERRSRIHCVNRHSDIPNTTQTKLIIKG